MKRKGRLLAALVLLVVAVLGGRFLHGWYGAGPLAKDAIFVVPDGATLTNVADGLEKAGAVASASSLQISSPI